MAPDRHYKRKHQDSLVTPSAYLCTHRSGPMRAHHNPYSILYDPTLSHRDAKQKKIPDRCARSGLLRRKARKIVRILEEDQGLKASRKLPPNIVCGSLRSSVRSIYAHELTLVQELSIKTSMKVEVQPCHYCKVLQDETIEKWRKARLLDAEVNSDLLAEFGTQFEKNVPYGWNTSRTPYIPNGHGSKTYKRKEGGNWCEEAYSPGCRVEQVYSSGKPRVVTLYSSYNVACLTPLHHSLYSRLKRKGWLLVGSPTQERLRRVLDGTLGREWLSFDYESATDNIKTAYVRRAVEILIDKGDDLTDDEIRCLRNLSSLSLDGVDAGTGQPMGSPMSFPLLCLINKTVVDMALTDLLIKGEIRFKEWSGHRCLINGDDLLTRSTSSGDLVAAIARRGAEIGLRVNKEKTMRDPEFGEINSTAFKNCVEQKKTNVAALWMAADVNDAIGFADQSCATNRGFKRVMTNNVSRLARQKIKTYAQIPFSRKEVLLGSKKLKAALFSQPDSNVPKATNLFPVVPLPEGYDLSREEEAAVINRRVEWIRKCELYKDLPREARVIRAARKAVRAIAPERMPRRGLLKVLRPKAPSSEKYTLRIFADEWKNKRMEDMHAALDMSNPLTIVSDLSRVSAIVDEIKAGWRRRRRKPRQTRNAWR